MFTGIIEGIGQILNIEKQSSGCSLKIRSPFSLEKEQIGDSIVVSGCCLTITKKNEHDFWVDVSPETLRCTNIGELKIGSLVNLERARCLNDRLGGHLVQGHVDTTGVVEKRNLFEKDGQRFLELQIHFPTKLRRYLVEKGSITVDGVSLTLNSIQPDSFDLLLIPHTIEKTTLAEIPLKAHVNLEVDLIAKYVESLTQFS